MKTSHIKVGDSVTLNMEGVELVYGKNSPFPEKIMEVEMIVTEVDGHSQTWPETSFEVRVDHPEMQDYMLYHWAFDKVKK